MNICMSLGVTKLDHIQRQHIRGTLHINDNFKNERYDRFLKFHTKNESNVARKAVVMDFPLISE